jgi:hypothetical protein
VADLSRGERSREERIVGWRERGRLRSFLEADL